MAASGGRSRELGLVGGYMKFIITNRIIPIIAAFMLMPASSFSEESAMSQNGTYNGQKFYFGRTMIDISAPDAQVPRIDRGTIKGYGDLGLQDQFYVGRADGHGRLTYLETWTRQPLDEVGLDTVIDGKVLQDYDVPITGDDIASQKPQFFMRNGDEWHAVSTEATMGETIFIRLRWLAPLRGGKLQKDAETFRQSLSTIYEYVYGVDGGIEKIVLRQSQHDFTEEIIFENAR